MCVAPQHIGNEIYLADQRIKIGFEPLPRLGGASAFAAEGLFLPIVLCYAARKEGRRCFFWKAAFSPPIISSALPCSLTPAHDVAGVHEIVRAAALNRAAVNA